MHISEEIERKVEESIVARVDENVALGVPLGDAVARARDPAGYQLRNRYSEVEKLRDEEQHECFGEVTGD